MKTDWGSVVALKHYVLLRAETEYQIIRTIWAASWQNQQNCICAQRRLRSDWAVCPGWSESSLGAHVMVFVLSRCSSYGEKFPLWTMHQVRLTLGLAICKICFRISNRRVLRLLIQSKGAMFHHSMFYDKYSVSHRLYYVCSINGYLHTVFAVYCTS